MKPGSTLKELRLMKGKTIKEACGDSVNRGNYWRIENEKVIPRLDTFNTILLNLNVSFSDYLELFYDGDDEYESLMSTLKKSFEMKKMNNLIGLSKYCEDKFELTRIDYYLHIKCLSEIFMNRINNAPYNQKCVGIIKEFLFNCPNWTYYEVRLLINSLFLYDDSSMMIFYFKTLRYVEKVEKRKNCDELKMKISENLITHFIFKKNYKRALEVFKIMSNLELQETSTNPRIIKLWVTGIVEVIIKEDKHGFEKIEKSLSIYKSLDMEGHYRLHKTWTSTLIK